jgi:hypothetical protein
MNLLKENDVHERRGVFRGRKQPLFTEYAGFAIGDQVRLKIAAVPPDHRAKIMSLNSKKEFKVLLSSQAIKDAKGVWGPIWTEEMEKVENDQPTH